MTFAIWGTESDVATGSRIDKEMVTALPNGGYVVVWKDHNTLKFQIYNGLGAKVGTAKALPSTGGIQYIADIQAVGNEGNFAISWNDGLTSIRTRVFDADGTDVSGPNPIILKSALSLGNLDSPAMATWGASRFVTAYTEGNKIQLALQDSKGVLQRTIEVAAANTLDQVDVTEIAVGKFVVSYAEGQDTIFFKIVDVIANTLTEAFEVGAGDDADVVALKDANGSGTGAFAVTTQNAETVQTIFYSAAGTRGNTVTVTLQGLDEYDYVHTAALKSGRVAVVSSQWVGSRQSPTDNGDIFLTIVNADGTHVTYSAPLNARSASDVYGQQYTPTITEMADGRVAVAWDDPSYDAITSVIFDPRITGVNVNGTTKNDIYVGSEYKDELFGNGGNDQLQGGLDDDTLHGGAGDDSLLAGAGNDRLAGGDGKDSHNGGAGLDIATYEFSTAGVGVTASLDLAFKHITSGEAKDDTYSEVENLGGSAWADKLLGNGGQNALFGANGADALYGGGGGDLLDGGGDRDAATYEYSTAGVGVRASLEDSGVNLGEAKGDTYASIEVLVGTAWNDVLIGRSTVQTGETIDDEIYGASGDDSLEGGVGNDKLNGGQHNDTLEGGADADQLAGGDGFDYISYLKSTVGVNVNLDTGLSSSGDAEGDTFSQIEGVIGSGGNDTLAGGRDFAVSLMGKGGADVLTGGGYNDTLEGGAGADQLTGGGGLDLASYAGAGSGVSATLADSGPKSGDAAGDQYFSIEGLIGSAHADTLSGNSDANTLRGGAQNDTLNGATGADRLEGEADNDALIGGAGADTLQGGTGDDNLDGGDDADRLEGEDGRDVLKGGTGADALDGGAGDDNLDGGADSDRLDGGLGNDVLNGGAGADTLVGGAGDDTYHVDGSDTIVEGAGQGTDTVIVTSTFTLSQGAFIENIVLSTTAAVNMTGNELDNVLTGNAAGNALDGQAGNDTIVGGAGADAMTGGVGNDLIYVDDARDVVVEQAGQGSDTVMVNTAVYALSAGAEVETLVAGSGAVRLTASNFANAVTGNALSNQLWGLAGNDRIAAGSGNDKIYGGLGNDTLYGEGGRDIFVFDTKTNKSTNVDRVEDFRSRDDSIYLENRIFTKLGSGTASKPKKFNADMFVQGKKALDREDRIIYDKKTGALYYDQDGTGSKAQVKIATLDKNLKLYYHDFYVI